MKGKSKLFIAVGVILSVLITFSVLGCPRREAEPEPEPREKFHLGITAGRPGDTWFVLSHALATFINERSEWVTAEVVATAGVADNTRLLVAEKDRRATHLNVTMIPGVTAWGEGQHFPLKVASLGFLDDVWVTLDPAIKTLADFEGKTVVLSRDLPYGYGWIFDNWLRVAGVENYRLLHGGVSARRDALRDGAAPVGVLPVDMIWPDEHVLSSSMMELSARGTLYFPNQGNVERNLAQIALAGTMEPFVGEHTLPPLGMVIPAGRLGPTQTEPLVYISTPLYWAAGIEVPEDVVYEVTRILYEAASRNEFAAYHAVGRGIVPDFVARSFWRTDAERRANYHPGALRFYDEKGITLKHFTDP
ncbi:MAG TPA: TAXI family TRAP transporter solute-binding subunit [Bacillota bacterium]|nr:TAXI family TRAP transporter solute-binding subunit [Bacillota bacterium]